MPPNPAPMTTASTSGVDVVVLMDAPEGLVGVGGDGGGQPRYHFATAVSSASASGALPAMNGKTCCMPSTTERVTKTPAASARSATRVALSTSDSAAPAFT